MAGILSRTLTTILISLGLTIPALAGVTVGEAAPPFRLQDQKGNWHSLEQYSGKWIVLYFYPKDDTPGCTKEACAFRDNIFAFEDIGAIILGVSLDDVASHQAFAEKYSLPFSLLSDAEKTASTNYGVLNKIGTFTFAKRESFIIDPAGNIARHYDKVDAESHSVEVLADLKELMNPAG
ncbi:MAG: peroxiredoxin [Gammaproteobacteria bacterium]|nr:peroxiredoxin [Chromatiales bacterium]MDP6673685.1 peroxiredoxin [Gammaproteobacteria bacterium]